MANTSPTIRPISDVQRQQVIEQTQSWIKRANQIFDCQLQPIAVRFDLIGRAAGMYRVKSGHSEIRYNPYLLARYFQDSLDVTIPHEVAHYVVDKLHGRRRGIKPHGEEWKTVMRRFGIPNLRASVAYDLDAIPQRRQARFDYRCDCGPVSVGPRRHANMQQGRARYLCRRCGHALQQIA